MAINYDEIMSMTSENVEISYTDKDSILYSLGVGFGNDPMNTDELKYVYENSQIALHSMATNFQYHSPLLLKAKINFAGRNDKEISFQTNEVLEVSDRVNDTWYFGRSEDKLRVGFIPVEYVVAVDESFHLEKNGHKYKKLEIKYIYTI